MKKAVKIEYRCDNQSYCSARIVCPTGAIDYDFKERMISINEEKCIGCAKCVRTCPRGALKLSE